MFSPKKSRRQEAKDRARVLKGYFDIRYNNLFDFLLASWIMLYILCITKYRPILCGPVGWKRSRRWEKSHDVLPSKDIVCEDPLSVVEGQEMTAIFKKKKLSCQNSWTRLGFGGINVCVCARACACVCVCKRVCVCVVCVCVCVCTSLPACLPAGEHYIHKCGWTCP